MTYIPYIAGPAAALAVLLLTAGLVRVRVQNPLTRTLGSYVGAWGTPSPDESERQTTRRAVRDISKGSRGAVLALIARAMTLLRLDQRVSRFAPWLTRQLIRADLSLTVREFVLLAIGVAAGGLFVGSVLWGVGVGSLLGAAIAIGILVFYVRFKQKRRLKVFGDQLPEVLSVLIINLRAGLSIMQAFDNMSKQIRPPAALEFGAVIRETRLGVPAEQALRGLARRIDNPDLHLLVNAVIIQRETGGNLINMMETIEATVRERVKIRGEVRTLTAQTSMGGYIITGLPIVLALALYFINPSGISFFWSDLLGMVMGGATILCVAVGNMVLRRIAKVEL